MIIFILGREVPVVELHPKEPQVLRVGESTRFACRVIAGIPYPTVTWARVDGRPLPAKAEQDYPGVITFHSVALSDAGSYQCVATNEAGTTSLTSTLEVQEPPLAVFKPDDPYIFVREGHSVDIVCTATGFPTPNVVIKTPKGQYDLIESLPASSRYVSLINEFEQFLTFHDLIELFWAQLELRLHKQTKIMMESMNAKPQIQQEKISNTQEYKWEEVINVSKI